MDKEAAVQSLTDTMAKFTAYIGKRLPKDVKAKLADLRTRNLISDEEFAAKKTELLARL